MKRKAENCWPLGRNMNCPWGSGGGPNECVCRLPLAGACLTLKTRTLVYTFEKIETFWCDLRIYGGWGSKEGQKTVNILLTRGQQANRTLDRHNSLMNRHISHLTLDKCRLEKCRSAYLQSAKVVSSSPIGQLLISVIPLGTIHPADQRYFDLILFVEFDLKSQLELDLNLDSSCTLI